MLNNYIKLLSLSALLFKFFCFSASAEIINGIDIKGNERIADETILMFSKTNLNDDIDEDSLNKILKNLYNTNFFENVSVSLKNNILTIVVKENPIIENISYNGIKSKTLKSEITKNLKLKPRSSYDEIILSQDKDKMISSLKNSGYYFSTIEIKILEKSDNKIDLIYEIELGKKAKIKKISFIGNKIFKDGKLKSLIISEEYKFWKIISGKKYLNENYIKLDNRLLKNFYLNKGFYDVTINSSFAKLFDDESFELIFNIDAKKKFFFDNLELVLPNDFDNNNFKSLKKVFSNLKNKPYSINAVENIINEIDKISVSEQYEASNVNVIENILDNKINLTFQLDESEKFIVEKINIFGNNITRESVIRNQFYIDEGDFFNDILTKKTINRIKSLNFFNSVVSQVIEGKDNKSKVINITVEEKPTGEIMAGAGFGTDGEVFEFGVKENNFLGKGIGLDTNLSVASDKIEGNFNVRNPNFNNTDKSINFGIQANETDKLAAFGYKSKKVGASIGTDFEYLEDLRLGLQLSSFVEDIETDSSASSRQKKQEGNYFDTYTKLNFDYDKRNQRYKTSDGFRSFYSVDIPLLSDNNTLTNYYNYKFFSELYENNISSVALSLSSANSLTGDDVKLSERLYIPSKKLRGFVRGKVGPKDGSDYVGGNYYAIINLSSSLPQVLPNFQNIDIGTFLDVANLWGVDDKSLDETNEIRSSVGIGVDWFTPVGPLSFSFAQPITKGSSDKTETFRFNLGTTF